MITLEQVGVFYDDAERPVLADVSFQVPEGDLALVVGRTGSGKSTLLGTINGLVPHFTGGVLTGRVVVDGIDVRTTRPREMAAVVGVVGQDPLAGFVTDTVEEELAYGMEQLAVPPATMRKRVEETLDLLGIAELRDRALRSLSGGQQQRVAIASVLTAHPRVLVLDEPTSALDPVAAEDVLAILARLVDDLGVTVIMAEHRLERALAFAHRLIHVRENGSVEAGSPDDVIKECELVPPLVELGRTAGWDPLPLTVRAARRAAAPLRERLAGLTPEPLSAAPPRPALLQADKLTVRYGQTKAVDDVDLQLSPGSVTALMGRNGSGKSSLLWALQGSGPRTSGQVSVGGVDPAKVAARQARQLVGMVPQTPGDLLYLDTTAEECAAADAESHRPSGSARNLLESLAPGIPPTRHPRDLSEGQRLSLVLAVQLVAAPKIMLLDEPTRGLDYPAKHHLTETVRDLADQGHAVVVATHDVEFAAQIADRVLVMAGGEIVADGPAPEVLAASPAFAPQIAKVLAPLPLLTVADVLALNGTSGRENSDLTAVPE
jgi:energy-coupling factor transport system ATP-binding protein